VLALAAALLLRQLFPLGFLPEGFPAGIGPGVVVASFGMFFWAVATMRLGRASIPTHKPTETIITGGPYRFSRNPIYVSMLALQVGVALWANCAWFLVFAAASAALLFWGVVAREERYLERKFGNEYTSYKAHVRRWL
jgi:protein-S-isoprenylcysteine O-methyltransferase Ste14